MDPSKVLGTMSATSGYHALGPQSQVCEDLLSTSTPVWDRDTRRGVTVRPGSSEGRHDGDFVSATSDPDG